MRRRLGYHDRRRRQAKQPEQRARGKPGSPGARPARQRSGPSSRLTRSSRAHVLCSESAAEAGRSVRAWSSRSHQGVCLHRSQEPVCRQRVPAATAVTHGSRYGTRRPQATRVPRHDIVSCACDALTRPDRDRKAKEQRAPRPGHGRCSRRDCHAGGSSFGLPVAAEAVWRDVLKVMGGKRVTSAGGTSCGPRVAFRRSGRLGNIAMLNRRTTPCGRRRHRPGTAARHARRAAEVQRRRPHPLPVARAPAAAWKPAAGPDHRRPGRVPRNRYRTHVDRDVFVLHEIEPGVQRAHLTAGTGTVRALKGRR